ncbi:ABC transporter family substrate-binding protein [Trueperella sp. LYQ143]|uniref:ABC transporter family substrate-binding protein n=1 Tax=unclassified Trueperella TaxID=2630174 RepID=UPI003982E415
MRKMKAGFALLAVGALALSGCSGSKGGSEGGKGGSSESSKELPVSDYNKVDPAELQDGGTLKLAFDAYPEQFNPFHVDGNTVDIASTLAAFVSPMNWLYSKDGGSFEPNKNYVESYEFNDKGEGDAAMVVKLKLNPSAKWNSGTPITVNDYIATWKACSHQVEGVTCASDDGWKQISSIEPGANEFEVVAKYSEKYPDWSANFSTVGPAAGLSDQATFDTGWLDAVASEKFGTGPFHITKGDPATNVITLERNPNWWGPKAKLDTVTISILKPEAKAQAYANKELDVLDMIVDSSTYATAKGRDDGAIKMSTSVQWRHLTFNSRAEALKDKKVRQAILKGIDTKDITASDLAGLPSAEMNMHLGNHFFMPDQPGYEDNSVKYDPEGAKKDLEALGYKLNAAGYYEKDGKTLGFKFLRIPDVPTSANEGAMLTDMMKEIGVKVEYTDIESKKFFSKVIGGEYEVTAFAWNGTPYPMANIGQIYGNPFDEKGELVNSNFTGLDVPEIDKLVGEVAKETDVEKRRALTNEADKLVWENVMNVPLYYRANITAIPANLANYGSTAFESLPVENIGYTK